MNVSSVYFSLCEISPLKSIQRAYDRQVIKSLGYIMVQGQLKSNIASELQLFVVKDGAHPLLGREWFAPLGIRVNVSVEDNLQIYAVSKDLMNIERKLIQEFSPAVFMEELGTYTNGKVSLVVAVRITCRTFARLAPAQIRDTRDFCDERMYTV